MFCPPEKALNADNAMTSSPTATSSPFGPLGDGSKPLPDLETCRQYLTDFGREVSVPRGTKLTVGRIYYLLEGTVTLTALPVTGERLSLIYFQPGDLLSFIPAVNHAYAIPHEAYDLLLISENLAMFTKTPCRLMSMEPEAFIRHMDEEPLKTLLVHGLAGNLMKIIVQSVNNSALPATVRVCRMLSVFMDKKDPHALPRYLTYREIAGHLSMHVMTVTKIFQTLRREGILGKADGVTFVRDPAALMNLSSPRSLISYVRNEDERRA